MKGIKTRDDLTTIHREFLNTWVKLKHPPPHATETKTDRIRRSQERLHANQLPLPQVGTALPQEVSPEPMIPPVGKKEPREDMQLPHYCRSLLGSPHSSFYLQGLQDNLQGLTTGNLIVTEGGGACNNQHSDLGRPSSCLQHPSTSSLNQQLCSSAEPSDGTV